MDGLLVTLGCSWVKGIGAQYEDGMSMDEYREHNKLEEYIAPHAFRTLLAERNNLEIVNFGEGGSSNKKQFRYATEFFSSPEFEEYQNKYSTIIVLWGLTSTARTEKFDTNFKQWINLLYGAEHRNDPDYVGHNDIMLRRFYDNQAEIDVLSDQMRHWNEFFKYKGVKNLWFDILNHHDYKYKFDNLCMDDGGPRDLLSRITTHKTRDRFHFSIWKSDCSRSAKGVFTKTLNPHSNHPTKKGHEKIFNLLDPYVKELLPHS
jgi:lysophospholipase L1-like esterase|tara:strand:+ start:22 stop:804 length:783 start_codon:yes stop_codon:yes gene_type:complete